MIDNRKAIMIALVVLVGALGLRLVNCNRGMWGDEITTCWVSSLPIPHIVEERLAHNHLPTYFVLMHLWTKAVGVTKLTLRLPSIVPGALAVAAFFLICARRFPVGLSLFATTLFCLNSNQLFVSQSSRMYGLTVLLEVLFFGCFLRDLRKPSWKRYLSYATTVIAGCSLHLLFLQMAAVAAAMITWERLVWARSRRETRDVGVAFDVAHGPSGQDSRTSAGPPGSLARDLVRYLFPFSVGVVLMMVWVTQAGLVQRGHEVTPKLAWLEIDSSPLPLARSDGSPARRRVVDPSRTMIRIPFGDTVYWEFLQRGWLKYGTRLGLWTLAGGLLWSAFRRIPSLGGKAHAVIYGAGSVSAGVDVLLALEQWRAIRFALLWVFVPPLTMTVGEILFAWVPGPQTRWLAGGAAAWALLLACGVWRFPWGVWGQRTVASAVVALSIFFAVAWLRHPGDGLPQAFAYWQAHASPGDKVFLVHRGYLERAMEIEGIPLPVEPLRSGTVLENTGPELARHLREFAPDGNQVWVLNYVSPPEQVLEEAFTLLSPIWRADLLFRCVRCSVYRLSPIPTNSNNSLR